MSFAPRLLGLLRRTGSTVRSDCNGATAIEYSLLAAMMVVALVGILSVGGIADSQNATYGKLADTMKK